MTLHTVAIIDYGSGNLRSAAKAFERAATDLGRETKVLVTSDADTVRQADRVVLPGQGAFADCMRGLAAVPGMLDALKDAVRRRRIPFLGICVGMQLMADWGREFEDLPGLGWIAGEVVALRPADPSLKIPHMGWNDLQLDAPDHPVLAGIGEGSHCYFVHSYQFSCRDGGDRLAHVDHGGAVSAIVGRENLIGTQFHPEKSQEAGLRLIGNFLRWQP